MEYSTALADQARTGDAHAFASLYELIYQDLYRFALYTLKNTHDAEDAVSDTVTDAFHEIHSLQKPESFKAWIFRILTAKCKQRLKSYLNKTEELNEELPVHTPDLSEQMDVRNAFFSLDDEDRLILSLHIFGGYSSREIGQLMTMNDATVRSRQSRALKKLQDILH
ncbi:MAG: RNA polymerase sigma factor [Lachnospiraceae bacterium]|nr:RNA polymerase sigma factor [Lachnospiraceae bacterium]